MSIPSQRTIKRNLKELREVIDNTSDPVLARIAYAMERAVRWATENTVDWSGLAQQAREEAAFLKPELASIGSHEQDSL